MKIKFIQFLMISLLIVSCGTTQYREIGFGGGTPARNSISVTSFSHKHQKADEVNISKINEDTSVVKESDCSTLHFPIGDNFNKKETISHNVDLKSKTKKLKMFPKLLNKLTKINPSKFPQITKVNILNKKIAESKYLNYSSDAQVWTKVFLITLVVGVGLVGIAFLWLLLALMELVPFSWSALAAMATLAQVGLFIFGISLIIGLIALIMSF